MNMGVRILYNCVRPGPEKVSTGAGAVVIDGAREVTRFAQPAAVTGPRPQPIRGNN